MKSRPRRVATFCVLAALLVPLAACNPVVQSSDDIARVVARTQGTTESVTRVLDDAASASSRNSDELARILAKAATPPETAIANTRDRLSRWGVTDDVANGIVCDVLAEVALDPDGVSQDELEQMINSSIVAALGGEAVGLAFVAQGIADDVSAGEAGSSLWARVTLMKLQYC